MEIRSKQRQIDDFCEPPKRFIIVPQPTSIFIIHCHAAYQVTAAKIDGGSAGEGGKAGTHPQPEQALLGVGHGALAGVKHDLENG